MEKTGTFPDETIHIMLNASCTSMAIKINGALDETLYLQILTMALPTYLLTY
jgi:hypothetical protein